MYNLIPLLITLFCLVVIIIIIAKKFPALASLDVDNMPAEKEAKFKERIISTRLKRSVIEKGSYFGKIFKIIGEQISKIFKSFYDMLHAARDDYKRQEKTAPVKSKNDVDVMISEIAELMRKDEFESAEKKLIEVIGLDSKNLKAFALLGELYFELKNYDEARQTFRHLIKLAETAENIDLLSEAYYDLAMVEKASEQIDEAIKMLKKALSDNKNNPRYLDAILELGIMKKDRVIALEAYEKLKTVNPENQKLTEFKKQIDKL